MQSELKRTCRTLALALALGAAGCARADVKPFAGAWQRSGVDAGELRLTIKPTGAIELRQSHPATAADSLMKGPGVFRADTLSFVGAPCERGEARYLLRLEPAGLTVSPLGADGCGTRRKLLSGTWARQ